MATELAVELSDLRGWGNKVGRIGDNCTGMSTYLRSNVTDGDFGMILQLITGDYEKVIPTFTDLIGTDGTRLNQTDSTIQGVGRQFVRLDGRVAQTFGVGKAITDDGSTDTGFSDTGTMTPPAPSADASDLPEVSFGFIFDKICDLTNTIIGVDPREYVTKWIAGDVHKAALQASAWQHVSDCLDTAERNLKSGQSLIDKTWRGDAAVSSRAYVDQWVSALAQQSKGTAQISSHLHDMIRGAVDLAQNVVDIIRMIISICSSALAESYIPLWGEWKAIKTIKEAWEMFKKARKCIQAFWRILTTIKDLLITVVHDFSITGLPSTPSVPAAP